MFAAKRLPISGHGGELVPNEFLRQQGGSDHLAVLLPGLGYTCDMPLFYYAEGMLLDAGADVLRVEYAYRLHLSFGDIPAEERTRWLFADTTAALRIGLGQRPYREITFVGKSLGTLAMGHLLGELTDRDVRTVWLTPLLRDDDLRGRMLRHRGPALLAIGTADDHYQPTVLDDLREATGSRMVIVEDADHSLDIPGDPVASIAAVSQVVAAMQAFIASG